MQKKTKLKLTKREQDLRIVHDYKREYSTTEVDPDRLTEWAIKLGLKAPEPISFFKKAKKELIQAMRSESHIDDQGREVGTMIAIRKPQQKSLWLDLYEAKPKKVHIALSQQRRSMSAWIRRHKDTVDSYNDNNKYGAQIPDFDYNFNKDLKEAQLPLEYPDDAPGGDS